MTHTPSRAAYPGRKGTMWYYQIITEWGIQGQERTGQVLRKTNEEVERRQLVRRVDS